ncbi:PCNA-interacting partner-like [Uloborus diversus]|uniref:PCNA-interacting partner-like n=1 Tax=Uloborus diversus TaxID=327109 RepID=UPI002409E7DF|nr:PCNA-interacting partner-like [Uloborus diversus]
MDNDSVANVWLWKDPDLRWKNEVINYVKLAEPSENEIILVHCSFLEGFDSLSLTNYILSLCLLFDLFEDEKIMFLNSKDLILSIKLCLKKFNNKNAKDINESLISHLAGKKFIILGIPQSEIIKKFICSFCGNEIFSIFVETPLDISLSGSPTSSPKSSPPKINVVAEPLEAKDIPVEDSNYSALGSATEEYAAEIIIAFLSLLVNSRNELALSKSMISPIVNFSHEAFTKLRHLASEKEMPMCQVAISYVTRVKLGGKGYAPSSDCPMLPHLKSLELFVDILNHMQTMVEEDVKPESVVRKLVIFLKKRLLKCGSDKLKASSVEAAAANLLKSYENLPGLLKCNTDESKQGRNCNLDGIKGLSVSKSAPQICQESLDIIRSFVNYINCNCWIFEAENILSKRQTKRTPLNLPPLLGYFRSPEEESTCDSVTPLNEDSQVSQDSTTATTTSISYFHHSDNSLTSTSCIDSSTPTKTNFKDCFTSENDVALEEKEPLKTKVQVIKKTASKGRKRSILKEITNDDEANASDKKGNCVQKKKREDKTTHQEASKGSIIIPTAKNIPKKNKKMPKTLKQVQGQVKITGFFVTGRTKI